MRVTVWDSATSTSCGTSYSAAACSNALVSSPGPVPSLLEAAGPCACARLRLLTARRAAPPRAGSARRRVLVIVHPLIDGHDHARHRVIDTSDRTNGRKGCHVESRALTERADRTCSELAHVPAGLCGSDDGVDSLAGRSGDRGGHGTLDERCSGPADLGHGPLR